MSLRAYVVTKRISFADGSFADFSFKMRSMFPPKCGAKCGCGVIIECWPL